MLRRTAGRKTRWRKWLPREQLTSEDPNGGAREVDATPRGARLHRRELARVGAALDSDGLRLEVEVAIAQREQLALAQACQRGEDDHVPVRRDGVGRELFDLIPLQEAHLPRLAPRRLDTEDGLVEEVAALLRVCEHLLEQAQGELGLARRALREHSDVILDGGPADLVERHGVEDAEVLHQVARAVERGGSNAERIAVQPAGGEPAERLRRRLVERPE